MSIVFPTPDCETTMHIKWSISTKISRSNTCWTKKTVYTWHIHTRQGSRKRRILLCDTTTFSSTRLSTGSKTRWRGAELEEPVLWDEKRRRGRRRRAWMKRNTSTDQTQGHRSINYNAVTPPSCHSCEDLPWILRP